VDFLGKLYWERESWERVGLRKAITKAPNLKRQRNPNEGKGFGGRET